MTDQSTVDFSKMPQNELATALGRINKDRYPANYAACEREILARKSSGVWVERAGLPEVTRLRPEFSLRRRFFSFSLDGVAISAIAVLFFPLSGLINQMGAAAILPFWALCVAYFAVLEGPAGQGQTLGKKLMGLRVVREDGETLSLRQSSLRSLFALALFGFRYGLVSYLPSSPVFQVLGGIVAVFNVAYFAFLLAHPQRRSLGDLLTGALVIDTSHSVPKTVMGFASMRFSLKAGLGALSLGVGAFFFLSALPRSLALGDRYGSFKYDVESQTSATFVREVSFAHHQDGKTVRGTRFVFWLSPGDLADGATARREAVKIGKIMSFDKYRLNTAANSIEMTGHAFLGLLPYSLSYQMESRTTSLL